MRRLVLIAALTLPSCSLLPHPTPPVPPPECSAPPTTQPQCPRGQEPGNPPWVCGENTGWKWEPYCVDQNHGVVCNPGETCGCWVLPPDENDWRELTCPPKEGYIVECSPVHSCSYTIIQQPPPPPLTYCPKIPAPGATVYLKDKAYHAGFDATVRVKGDPEFCKLIHGVSINDCHLESWPERVECEMELLGGCPEWQFIKTLSDAPQVCHDNHDTWASCDHFGSVEFRDDPQTKTVFEGQPLECGLQRDEYGPNAGFFTIAHGIGYIRACPPNGPTTSCGPWRPFNH